MKNQKYPLLALAICLWHQGKPGLNENNKRHSEHEEEEDKGMRMLVSKNSRTKVALARVVPKKGRDQYAIERLLKDIANLGCKKLISKVTMKLPLLL